MAVRSGWAVAVARGSAAAWQRVACNPETLPADQVLGLLCCAPLYLLARLAAFLCIPFIPAQTMPRLLSPRIRTRGGGHPRLLLLLPPQEDDLLAEEPIYSPFPSSSSSSSSSDDDDDDDEDVEDIHLHFETGQNKKMDLSACHLLLSDGLLLLPDGLQLCSVLCRFFSKALQMEGRQTPWSRLRLACRLFQAMPCLLSPRIRTQGGHPRLLLLLPPQEDDLLAEEPIYSPFPSSSSSSSSSDDDDDDDEDGKDIHLHFE
uniref:Uncharacterized protein n=1 Tax=Leersia perrieri TaxID=77586 RepID=A0A0D9W0E9_9ORYZ